MIFWIEASRMTHPLSSSSSSRSSFTLFIASNNNNNNNNNNNVWLWHLRKEGHRT